MDSTSNQSDGQNSPNSEANPQRPFERVISAVRTGADDARKAAEQAMPKIKAAASSAAYWAAYGASFATVFEWTLLELGCRDGIKAGKAAAEKWFDSIKGTRPAPAESPVAPMSERPEPGAA